MQYMNNEIHQPNLSKALEHFTKKMRIVSYVPETTLNEDQELEGQEAEQEYEEQFEYEEELADQTNNIALFVESRRGKTVLQYNGHRYRKAYKSRNGTRWNCSLNKNCSAFMFLSDQDEILMSHEEHDHPQPTRLENIDTDQNGRSHFEDVSLSTSAQSF